MAISPKDKSILYLVLKNNYWKDLAPISDKHSFRAWPSLYFMWNFHNTTVIAFLLFEKKYIGAVSAHCPDTNMIRRVQMDTCSSTRATMYLFGGSQMKMGKSMSQKMLSLYFIFNI